MGELGECIGVVWIKVNGVGFVAGLELEKFLFFINRFQSWGNSTGDTPKAGHFQILLVLCGS